MQDYWHKLILPQYHQLALACHVYVLMGVSDVCERFWDPGAGVCSIGASRHTQART